MARAAENVHFTGTIGNVCYYQWGDRTFARKKSSLTRKRVLKSKEFAATRKYAGDMGRASKMASEVYRSLPADIKGRWIFRAIAGDAATLLYKGKDEQEVKEMLWKKYVLQRNDRQKIAGNKQDKEMGKMTGLITVKTTKQLNKQYHELFLEQWEKQGKPAYWFKRAWEHGSHFNPETIPRRSEYFLGIRHAARLE